MEAGDDGVDPAAGFAIGGFDAGGADAGVGDDFDGFVDVIEDHEFAIEGEEEVGELAVVLGGRGEFFAFVISDGVIARVADEAAGEAQGDVCRDDIVRRGEASGDRPGDRWW